MYVELIVLDDDDDYGGGHQTEYMNLFVALLRFPELSFATTVTIHSVFRNIESGVIERSSRDYLTCRILFGRGRIEDYSPY